MKKKNVKDYDRLARDAVYLQGGVSRVTICILTSECGTPCHSVSPSLYSERN